MFGEMSLAGIVTASVIAESRVEVFAIDMALTNSLFESEAGLTFRFWCRIAQGLAKILISIAPPKKRDAPPVIPEPGADADTRIESNDVPNGKKKGTSGTSQMDTLLVDVFGLDKSQVVMKRMIFKRVFIVTSR